MKLFVLILSCHKFAARREACRETWLPRLLPNMQYRFYVGEGPAVNEQDVVQLSVSDSYLALRDKTPAALTHALQFEWDWLFKCDDDVYVVPERLEAALKSAQLYYGYTKRETRPKEPHYVGCVTQPGDFYGYGGGYFLDRWLTQKIMRTEAADRIKHADLFVPSLGEDGWIGHLARKHVRYWTTDMINCKPEPVPTIYNNLVMCHRKNPIAMCQAHLSYIRV